MTQPTQRSRPADNDAAVIDGYSAGLVQPALQPPCPRTVPPLPIAERHQRRELERVRELEAAQLQGGELGRDDVAGLDRRRKIAVGCPWDLNAA